MNAMKVASIIVGIVLFGYTILLLAQLWAGLLSAELFFKVTVTAGVVVVVALALALLYREYIEEKSMKSDGYLD